MATSTDFGSLDRLPAVQELYQRLALDANSTGTRACIEELDDEVERATPSANFFQSVLHVDEFVPQQQAIENLMRSTPNGYVTCMVPVSVLNAANSANTQSACKIGATTQAGEGSSGNAQEQTLKHDRTWTKEMGLPTKTKSVKKGIETLASKYVVCMGLDPVRCVCMVPANLQTMRPSGNYFDGVVNSSAATFAEVAERWQKGVNIQALNVAAFNLISEEQARTFQAVLRSRQRSTIINEGILSEDTCSGTSSSIVKSTNTLGVVLSDPVSKAPMQCFLADAMLVDSKGIFVPLNAILAGHHLRCACDVNGTIVSKTVAVKAIRCLPPRERDFVTITSNLKSSQVSDELEPLVLSLTITSDHSVLSRSDCGSWWGACQSKQLERSSRRSICAVDIEPKPSVLHEMTITNITKYVDSCDVWELEVEDPSSALLVCMNAVRMRSCGAQEAELQRFGCVVFGCAPREKQIALFNPNRMTFDIEGAGKDTDSVTGSKCASDPTFDAPPPVSVVYSVIKRPHDKDCKAICKAYFKGNCSKGILCGLCHHEDHMHQAISHRSRRGKNKIPCNV